MSALQFPNRHRFTNTVALPTRESYSLGCQSGKVRYVYTHNLTWDGWLSLVGRAKVVTAFGNLAPTVVPQSLRDTPDPMVYSCLFTLYRYGLISLSCRAVPMSIVFL